MFTRGFERLKNQEVKTACMLPNVARYQLRHTPKQWRLVGATTGSIIAKSSKKVNPSKITFWVSLSKSQKEKSPVRDAILEKLDKIEKCNKL